MMTRTPNLPPEPLAQKPFDSMTDTELHQLRRDFSQFHDKLGRIAAGCKMRARAIQSILDRRSELAANGTPHRVGDSDKMPKRDRRSIEGSKKVAMNTVTVSDHALVRYLDRVKGLDLEAFRREIEERIHTGESYYAGSVVVDREGYTYIRRPGGFIKTVMPGGWLEEGDGQYSEQKFREYLEHHGEDEDDV